MPGPDGGREVVDGLGPHLGELALPAPGPSGQRRERAGSRPSARRRAPPARCARRPGSRRTPRSADDRTDRPHAADRRPGRGRRGPAGRGSGRARSGRAGGRARQEERRPDQQQADPDAEPEQRAHQRAPVEQRVHVDAEPLVAVRPRRHARRRGPAAAGRARRAARSRSRRSRPGRGPRRSLRRGVRRRASMPRCTTRSTDDATVGTTKRAEMFSPASSGSVHILTSASRALLACSGAMPGRPALSASSRSRHSSARTSPTIIRRRPHPQALLDQVAQRDLARCPPGPAAGSAARPSPGG